MTIERISLVCLALIAVVMGANYVSAATRFYDANVAYESLALSLNSFTYTDPESPVAIDIDVENPADTSVDVLGLRVNLRAESLHIGGGEALFDETLDPGESHTFSVDAVIDDVNVLMRVESDEEIDWMVRGSIRVSLDEDVRPVWIDFTVRAVSQ